MMNMWVETALREYEPGSPATPQVMNPIDLVCTRRPVADKSPCKLSDPGCRLSWGRWGGEVEEEGAGEG